MKKLIPILFFSMAITCYAQNKQIDSLGIVAKNARDNIAKIKALISLSSAYKSYKPDSAIIYMQTCLKLAKRLEDKTMSYKYHYFTLSGLGFLFVDIGNYPKALAYFIEALKLAEDQSNPPDPRRVAGANSNIALIYTKEKDYDKALTYQQIADSLIQIRKDSLSDLREVSMGNFGNLYYKLNNLDSALYLTMLAYELAKEKKENDYLTGIWLNNLGNIYSKKENIPAAIKNYQEALQYSNAANDMDNVCESTLGLAMLFEKMGNKEAAIACANQVLALAWQNDFESRRLQVSEFLKAYYKKTGQYDSAFKYQEQMVSIKDSINSNERIRQSINITIEEELRQQEKREALLKEREDLNKTLQLLGAGMFIPSFFLFTIFIRRRKIKPQIIKFCGVASLLMLFECLTLILHPYVVQISNHIVIIELLIFVCIAAVVIPTHHKIEHWLLTKLTVHKNAVPR